MLPRVLEVEAIDTPGEAAKYDARDHDEANRIFVTDLLAAGLRPEAGEILDIGAGTAKIPIELCRRAPAARVRAVDAARHMLDVAQKNLADAGLAPSPGRIRLELADAQRLSYADGLFAAVVSNGLVHHTAEPQRVLAEAWRVTAPGGLLFFRDYIRPDDEATLQRLVAAHASGAAAHRRQALAGSLRAALRIDEVQAILADLGADPNTLSATSDRHWTWIARKG
ncbi:MAG: class I SAM-dependent methyltransferase [Pirellulales bacterium]|nr:class I SAM-dependent methyltransferase [Pirellulales bacterium]